MDAGFYGTVEFGSNRVMKSNFVIISEENREKVSFNCIAFSVVLLYGQRSKSAGELELVKFT